MQKRTRRSSPTWASRTCSPCRTNWPQLSPRTQNSSSTSTSSRWFANVISCIAKSILDWEIMNNFSLCNVYWHSFKTKQLHDSSHSYDIIFSTDLWLSFFCDHFEYLTRRWACGMMTICRCFQILFNFLWYCVILPSCFP